ncbi:MAG: chemotaxis protein MotB [Porticoccaceae bacterium]|jgi:chemotaxis protein MotB
MELQMKALQIGLACALVLSLAALGYLFNLNTKLSQEVERVSNQPSASLTTLQQEVDQYREQVDSLESVRVDLEQQLQQAIEQGKASVSSDSNEININLMGSILFTPADGHLTKDGASLLRSLGQSLNDAADSMIHVIGHTDNWPIGSNLRDKYPSNWELAATRAISVSKYLKEEVNIDPSRIYAISAAQYQPVADNESVEGRAQNRRIEIKLVGAR